MKEWNRGGCRQKIDEVSWERGEEKKRSRELWKELTRESKFDVWLK
jgi:hypothetical protein